MFCVDCTCRVSCLWGLGRSKYRNWLRKTGPVLSGNFGMAYRAHRQIIIFNQTREDQRAISFNTSTGVSDSASNLILTDLSHVGQYHRDRRKLLWKPCQSYPALDPGSRSSFDCSGWTFNPKWDSLLSSPGKSSKQRRKFWRLWWNSRSTTYSQSIVSLTVSQ